MKKRISLILTFFIALLTYGYPGHCLDVIKLPRKVSTLDKRTSYPELLLEEVLKITETTDGPFVTSCCEQRMSRNRGLSELTSGKLINVYAASYHKEWADKAIVVKIPIYKGLRSYRLLLVSQDNLDRFASVQTLEDLKMLRAGVGAQWPIYQALEDNGFKVVAGTSYDGLFSMLDANRFDYFPRGLGDIFTELENRQQQFPDMRIESTLALKCPIPIFFYVSPKNPELADRIQRGLELLIANGTYDALFHKHFDAVIERAQLNTRRILTMENPMLGDESLIFRSELWYTPKGPK